MYGFFTEVVPGSKYPKIIHTNQPYQGWMREMIVDDEGNTKVQFIPPQMTVGGASQSSSNSSSSSISTSSSSSAELTESGGDGHITKKIIRNVEDLNEYMSFIKPLQVCPSLLATSFDFDDMFCICHRADEGDYFNCDYGLTGCGSWFHSGK